MAQSISRIYLHAYETNKRFGKILLLIFVFVYLVPFVAIEIISLNGYGGVAKQPYARIHGMTAMQDAAKSHFTTQPNPAFNPMRADRPSRVKGMWNARKFQIVNAVPQQKMAVRQDRPSRIKGVWNMMNGGIN
jgi:hypothetical protein